MKTFMPASKYLVAFCWPLINNVLHEMKVVFPLEPCHQYFSLLCYVLFITSQSADSLTSSISFRILLFVCWVNGTNVLHVLKDIQFVNSILITIPLRRWVKIYNLHFVLRITIKISWNAVIEWKFQYGILGGLLSLTCLCTQKKTWGKRTDGWFEYLSQNRKQVTEGLTRTRG